ncbi:hypothetical protein ACF0H5_004180 [Mactra antiquata]
MSEDLQHLLTEESLENQKRAQIVERGPDEAQTIIGVVCLLLMCFGSVFNIIVIHAFRKTNSLQTPTNMLIMGIVVSDTAMVLLGYPFVIASSFNGYWMFGSTWCEVYGFIMSFLGVSCLCILTAVALDRYYVVTQSSIAAKITTFKAVMTILTCYGYGMLWATFPLVGWGGYVIEPNLLSCGPDWTNDTASSQSYSISIFLLVLCIPASIILYCYAQICITVRNNKIRVVDQVSRSRLLETRVAFSVLITIGSFFAAWMPYAIMSFWTMFNDVTELNHHVAIIAPLLAKSASVWNPFIYVCRHKEFRDALLAVVIPSMQRNRRRRNNENRSNEETGTSSQRTSKNVAASGTEC